MKSRQILALAGGATLLYALAEPYRLEVRRFDVFLENLPPAAENLRVLQISDLHAGAIQPRALRHQILAAARAENADLIALTGDLVSRRGSYSHLVPARYFGAGALETARLAAAELCELRPRLGIYAVPGNHDLVADTFAPIGKVLESAGIHTLVNRAVRLENGLVLAGLDDLRVGNPEFRATFEGIGADEAQLILNHNPRAAQLLGHRNALILSGHTHAGQIRLPLKALQKFPVDVGNSFYLRGFYNLGRAQLYVSRGAGYIHFPLRLRSLPEIAVFTLKRSTNILEKAKINP